MIAVGLAPGAEQPKRDSGLRPPAIGQLAIALLAIALLAIARGLQTPRHLPGQDTRQISNPTTGLPWRFPSRIQNLEIAINGENVGFYWSEGAGQMGRSQGAGSTGLSGIAGDKFLHNPNGHFEMFGIIKLVSAALNPHNAAVVKKGKDVDGAEHLPKIRSNDEPRAARRNAL